MIAKHEYGGWWIYNMGAIGSASLYGRLAWEYRPEETPELEPCNPGSVRNSMTLFFAFWERAHEIQA